MTIKQYGGVFGRNPTFNDVTIEGQLTFDGDIEVNTDLKVSGDIETTGNVIIATSGSGIDFSATGTGTGISSSELLDDYEEGTWAPVVTSSVGAITAYAAVGTYTKIGRAVSVNYTILIANNGTGSGSVKVDSLPFTQSGFRSIGVGLETDVVGFPFTSNGIGSTTFFYLSKIDGSYPAGTAYRLQGNFVYSV